MTVLARAPRASDLAYDELLGRILDLRLPPGAVVNELELAAETGFGRMPLREAIARLCGDRFITVLPRRGTFVTPLGLDDVLDMFEAREAIEAGVAHLAAARMTGPDLDRLRTLIQAAEEVRTGEPEDYIREDHAVHRYLVELVGNSLLQDAAERLLLHNVRFWRHYWAGRPARPAAGLSHADLLAALEAGDAEAASRAMRSHVGASRGLVQEAFRR